MNICNYTTYFHDGSLIDVFHKGCCLILSMESSEISVKENLDKTPLSEHSTIKGKLHLEGIESITENDKPIFASLKMLYDSARILHLKIQNTTIKLDLEWVNFPPHSEITAFSFYTIHAKKIWWENIPDLFDPFW